jgi:hypothetical protein
MEEQTFKGEEARTWLLGEGRKFWIFNNFRKIHILCNEAYHPLWRIIYLPIEPRGGLEGSFLSDYLDDKTDECDVFIDPNSVQKIYFSKGRYDTPSLGEMSEADACIRITLQCSIVELSHTYYKKRFGRLGYKESLKVRINSETQGFKPI